ncbi:reverse transcriptase domain-containing protein [Lentilactobacillus raoultii]|uniref:Reverse transcriptase domain-containing protein n=1 Tax=Lentilactobacillus raoultii TaxID=1987503 RepID=A0ABW3PH25_9LACO|nr:RNA-directed DNA polymerase [Lentilactobacillus raoultii]
MPTNGKELLSAKLNSSRKCVLDMTSSEAKKFFLKSSSFVSMQLPKYFNFDGVLKLAKNQLKKHTLEELSKSKRELSKTDEVNHKILISKDGHYDWRPVQIVHPIAYVNLVNIITGHWGKIINAFGKFQQDEHIKCISMPVESRSENNDTAETILNWWEELEQRSIECSLNYKYCIKTDITNCYGSIYTHTIAWAINGKNFAKKEHKRGVGNKIDKAIEYMQNGQTNGIPQGGPLFDFIAEIVLGYADVCLSRKLKDLKDDYKVIRYRDDYRIFTKSKEIAERIVKSLSDVLADLNMHFNTKKTGITSDIIGTAIKADKLFWTKRKPVISSKNESETLQYHLGLQKHLWQVYELARKFPNSGSVSIASLEFLRRLNAIKKFSGDYKNFVKSYSQLISIVSNIMVISPKSIPQEVAVLSAIFGRLSDEREVANFIENIIEKFKGTPNKGYIEIWLQRLSLLTDKNKKYLEPLCQKIYKENSIWNSSWLKKGFDESSIVDERLLDKLKMKIPEEEVDVFYKYWG